MKSIIITKYGSVFRPRSSLSGASAVGECGETEGVIRHLLERGDCQVIYFGQYKGGGHLPGLTVIDSDLTRVREVKGDPMLLSDDAQQAGFRDDSDNVLRAAASHPVAMICVDGYAPTFSHVYNPKGATVQCAAINYCAPQLALLESLCIPRICINNDWRCIPRDQEMSYGWEWTRPRACLGQWNECHNKVVGGKMYEVRTVHARAESWAYLEQLQNPTWEGRGQINIIAHAHIDDGMKKGSFSAWCDILSDAPYGTCVFGRGWDTRGAFITGGPKFMGECKPSQVAGLLEKTLCCPVVSHTPGFYTGKPYVLAASGCIPLFYGSGLEWHTYDPDGLLIPLDDTSRIRKPGDFAERLHFYQNSEMWACELALWREKLKPDWTLLDEVVDKLLSGTFEESERYGGYDRI